MHIGSTSTAVIRSWSFIQGHGRDALPAATAPIVISRIRSRNSSQVRLTRSIEALAAQVPIRRSAYPFATGDPGEIGRAVSDLLNELASFTAHPTGANDGRNYRPIA